MPFRRLLRPRPARSTPPRPARPHLEALEARWLPSVTLGTGFNGLAFGDTAGYVPPDTITAAGPNYVVEAVNTTLAIYYKTGPNAGKLQSSQSLQNFFSSVKPTSNLSDPFVSYDDGAGRFVVGVLDFGSNNLLLAVSDTSDPTNFTEKDRIGVREGSGFSATFADYPRFGYNGDAYVISLNMFNSYFGYYDHTQVVVVKKSSVLDKNPSTLSGFRTDRSGSSNFTLAPAVMHGGGNGLMWLVEEAGYGNGQQLDAVKLTYTWTSTGVTGVRFTDNLIDLPAQAYYGQPPAASQTGGGQIETNDARILNAAWRDNRLVAAQTVGESDGFAHARFYEISTSGTPALTQWADVTPGQLDAFGNPAADTYFPSVEINSKGEVGLTFLESSASEYLSMYVTAQTAANPDPLTLQGTLSAPVAARAGAATYNPFDSAPYRAGDYSGISVDPVDGSFWAANEYATGASRNNWGTFIQNFTDPPGGSAPRHSAPVAPSGVWQWPPPADHPLRLGGAEFKAPLQDFLLDHPALYQLLVSISQQLYNLHPHRPVPFFFG